MVISAGAKNQKEEKMDNIIGKTPVVPRETKVEMVKLAIGSEQGWVNLAQSIKSAANPKEAREECESILRDLAADKRVDIPALLKMPPDAMMITIEMGDFLVSQLDDNLRNLK